VPEQFERTIAVLREQGLLDRCTSLSCDGVVVTLTPKAPDVPTRREVPAAQPGESLFNALSNAFPGAAIPPSLLRQARKGDV